MWLIISKRVSRCENCVFGGKYEIREKLTPLTCSYIVLLLSNLRELGYVFYLGRESYSNVARVLPNYVPKITIRLYFTVIISQVTGSKRLGENRV